MMSNGCFRSTKFAAGRLIVWSAKYSRQSWSRESGGRACCRVCNSWTAGELDVAGKAVPLCRG